MTNTQSSAAATGTMTSPRRPRRALRIITAVSRILVGLFFVLAGQPKLTDPAHWAGNFRHWHVPLAGVVVVLVAVLEVFGGGLLILGVAARLISTLFVVDMIGAALFAGLTDGPAYLIIPAILGGLCLAYALGNAGAWQVYPDRRLLARFRITPA